MANRPVLLYVLGAAPEPVAAAHGHYVDWFQRLWRDAPVDVQVFEGTGRAHPPDPSGFAGTVLTGSPASMTEPEPWMEIAVEFTRHAAFAGSPVLGICFGHQLIGAAYGGSVVRNPLGWEVSTHDISLTADGAADLLFDGVDPELAVNLSHQDIVEGDTLAPANGIRVLARNDRTAAQALAAGDSIRAVQFHPEFTGAITRSYIETRSADLAADADSRNAPEDHPARLLERCRDTPAAERVFDNFTRHWILKS